MIIIHFQRSDRDRNVDERYARDRKRTSVDRDVNKEKLAPSAHIMIRGSPSKLNREDEVNLFCYLISLN